MARIKTVAIVRNGKRVVINEKDFVNGQDDLGGVVKTKVQAESKTPLVKNRIKIKKPKDESCDTEGDDLK